MGITDVIVKVNPDLTGLSDPWKYETLSSIVSRLKEAGLNVVGLEGDPFDMSPIKEYGAGEFLTGFTRFTGLRELGALHPALSSPAAPSLRSGDTPDPNNLVNPVNPVKNESGDEKREESLEHYRELLESMGKLGIKLLCYNFMVGKGWSRTGVREGRGGAKATCFSLKVGDDSSSSRADVNHHSPPTTQDSNSPSNSNSKLQLNADQVWANYEYFIKAVMPTAEKCGVRMGLHPDDPCLPSLGGYARIFGSVAAYDRAYALYPSPSNAVTFCQANFKLMFTNDSCRNCSQVTNTNSSARSASLRLCAKNSPENPVNPVQTLEGVARHFGKRIAFIHVRDVEGTKEDFTELFHDQGDTDQFALMRTYRELGLDVPVRGDHVPEMAYDRDLTPDGTPGYFTLGRLFANGYLKALLQGTTNP